MEIQPIRKVNVSEQVFEQLKTLLVQGQWKPGEKLPSENKLAQMFGVSRITVRQALQKLNVLGLVETRLGEGSFVRESDLSDSMNALLPAVMLSQNTLPQVEEFREMIEVESARLAVLRAKSEDLEELKGIFRRMQDSEGQPAAFGSADLDFHMKLGRMTQNVLVMKTQDILYGTLLEARDDIVERMGYKPGLYYHAKLLEAVEKKDELGARQIMKEHLQCNKQFFLQKEEEKDGLQ